ETTQVLAYAGRVLHLADEVFGQSFEEPFLKLLEAAPSNLPRFKSGRDVYEQFIRAMRIDRNRITAHYAISSLFENYPKQTRMFMFQVDREDAHSFEAGKTRLVAGKAVLTSMTTGEADRFTYGAVHFGDHNVNGGVRTFQSDEAYQALVD